MTVPKVRHSWMKGFSQLLVPMSRNIPGQEALALTGSCLWTAAMLEPSSLHVTSSGFPGAFT